MGLLDGNYQDERLTKKVKPAIQGGGYNYLGKQETVTVPKRWLSDPDHVVAELAYITPREAKVLLDLNLYGSLDGKPNNAPGGLPSLQGDMGSVGGGGSSGGGGNSGGGSGGGGNGRQDAESQYGADSVGSYDSSQNQSGREQSYGGGNDYTTPTPAFPPGVTPNVTYTNAEIEKGVDIYGNTITESVKESNLLEKTFDLYKQYGIIPNALKLGGSLLDKIGGVSKSLQNKAIAFDLQNKLEKAYQSPTFDPFSPDASVTQLEQDLARAKAGEYSQQEYQDRYAPQMNQTDQGGSERDAMNALTPYAPYAISGQTPQDSMVNQYFANMNMSQGSPLSSDLQTSYNNAKNSVNSILGITPTNQQFGYSAQPYGLLSSTNMADNPYNIPYLQQRGLI
jgi:hypothetical protein